MSDRIPTSSELGAAAGFLEEALEFAWKAEALIGVVQPSHHDPLAYHKLALRRLKSAASMLGLELVERHPKPTHVLVTESPITIQQLDQSSGKTTAAEMIDRGPR